MSASAPTPYHDFTLDELEAYDRGVLEPARRGDRGAPGRGLPGLPPLAHRLR